MDRPADQLRQEATSYARAAAGNDEDLERRLAEEIAAVIAKSSLLSDAAIMVIRSSETIEALITCLISVASLSPHFDTPSHLREFADTLAKRIRRSVAKNRADPPPEAESILGFHKGGSA